MDYREMRMILRDAVEEWAMPEEEKIEFLQMFDALLVNALDLRP